MPPLTIRDLAAKCRVEWLNGNRYRVTGSTGRIYYVEARWSGTDFIAFGGNPVARLAVEMHERSRVAGAQFN